ncbi:MAG: glycoside hydrolase family 2 [Lachnospiraceae bacterium]|nr:glycoside hydrolase family 2 [Lachnospiraceae bacterium]
MGQDYNQLFTSWGREFDRENILPEYPRPQMKRKSYVNLNGEWDYAFTRTDCLSPEDVFFNGKILVPYSPESILSGVSRQLKPDEYLWYRRMIELPEDYNEYNRLLIHFGAVDQMCKVYINRKQVYRHVGGYLPFTVDISKYVHPLDKNAELIICVKDTTEKSYHSRGKQLLNRGGMFYTAQSGIWKSVWMECVNRRYIKNYKVSTDVVTGIVHMQITVNLNISEVSSPGEILKVTRSRKFENISRRVRFSYEKDLSINVKKPYIDKLSLLDAEECKKSEGELSESLAKVFKDIDYDTLNGDGVDDIEIFTKKIGHKGNVICFDFSVTDRKLWSPENPNLYYFKLRVFNDEISGYFAFRNISIERMSKHPDNLIKRIDDDIRNHPRICLNHAPYFQNGVLDQGYWPEGLYTPPSYKAFLYDILKMKSLGYNMLRKHLKIEADRYYYYCDRIGMSVWQDMVNGGSTYHFWFVTYLATAFNMVRYRFFDNSYALLSRKDERGRREFEKEMKATVRLLYDHPCITTWVIFNEGWGQFDAKRITRELRKLDDTRIIDSTSGWFDQECGDIRSQHYYFMKLRVQWCLHRATVISEYGGFPLKVKGHIMYNKMYGYHGSANPTELKKKYKRLMENIIGPEIEKGLSATVYTQLSDVEEEVNGILTYDREVCKLDGKP